MTVTRDNAAALPENQGCGVYYARVRDTYGATIADAGETTATLDTRKWDEAVIYVNNPTDRTLVCTLQASDTAAFTESYDLPNPLSVTTLNNGFITLENFHPFVRLNVNPTGGIATGIVTVTWCLQTKGAI